MGKKIKGFFRTDNGGEYTSIDFGDFCKEAGIKRELTVPYNPPQNDVAVTRKRPTWLCDTLQDAKGHATPNSTFRESKQPQSFSSYVALMCHIIDSEPSNYESEVLELFSTTTLLNVMSRSQE
jgi:hypothetical protein